MPDFIIVYLGTNDWARGVEVRLVDNVLGQDEMEIFEDAYTVMLHKLQSNYPKAEIWCCTLNSTYISSNPNFVFPEKYAGRHIDEYNQTIRNIARANNCKLVDLDKYHWPYDSIDGSHPTSDGMNTLAMMVIREMGDEIVYSIINCSNNEHQYEIVEEYTGGTRYVCKKCGKEKYESMLAPPEDTRDRKIDAFIEEIYSKMDFEMREKIFYGGIESANTILTTICNSVYGVVKEDNIRTCQEVYIQVWIRSRGGLQSEFMTPSYIREALRNRFSYLSTNIVDGLVSVSLDVIYNNEPDLKEKAMQIEYLKNMVRKNAGKNIDIEDRHINDEAYGLSADKPIFVCGFDGAKIYLSQLKTEVGNSIQYNRLGSSEVTGIAGPVDLYEIVDTQENSKFLIYICNYGTKNSTVAPRGMKLKMLNDKSIEDSEYVLADPNKTTLLYNGSLQITVESSEQTYDFEKEKITVGRDSSSDLIIEKKVISRHHATLFYEHGMWLLSDNDSTNGTWLNGEKLVPGKKYQLVADDIIYFAHLERVAFYKSILVSNKPKEEEKAIAILEASIKAFAKSDYKDEVAYKLIASSLINAPLYFPVEIDLASMFGNIDPTT